MCAGDAGTLGSRDACRLQRVCQCCAVQGSQGGDGPFPEPRLVRCLCLVVRKFQLVLRGLLVVDVAGVASAQLREFRDKNVLATRWDVKYRPRYACFVHVQGKCTVELDLIHGLVRRPERLVYLCKKVGESARVEGRAPLT